MGGAYTAADVTINSIVQGSVVVDFSVIVPTSMVTAATQTFHVSERRSDFESATLGRVDGLTGCRLMLAVLAVALRFDCLCHRTTLSTPNAWLVPAVDYALRVSGREEQHSATGTRPPSDGPTRAA